LMKQYGILYQTVPTRRKKRKERKKRKSRTSAS